MTSKSVFSIQHISNYATALGVSAYENNNLTHQCPFITDDYYMNHDNYYIFVLRTTRNRTKNARYKPIFIPFWAIIGHFYRQLLVGRLQRVAFYITLNK